MKRLTSSLSSFVRRVVVSSCRRSSSSESRSASKTSVSALTDRAIASLRSTSRVGEELPSSDPTGREDTGLIYLRAREYDPATGQLLSVDPKVEQTGAVYTYAKDNPLSGGDPTGEFEISGIEGPQELEGTAAGLRGVAGNSALLAAAVSLLPGDIGGYAAITPGEYATFLLRWAAYFEKVAESLEHRKARDANAYLVNTWSLEVHGVPLPYRFTSAYCWFKGTRRHGAYDAFWCGKTGLVYQKPLQASG